eukprot:COSAG02_NODE_857_length_16462_cov_4.801381_16_plen_134_part_00
MPDRQAREGTLFKAPPALECAGERPFKRLNVTQPTAASDCFDIISGRCFDNTFEDDVECSPGTAPVQGSPTGSSQAECCDLCPAATFSPGHIAFTGDACNTPFHVTHGSTFGIQHGYGVWLMAQIIIVAHSVH